MSVNAPTLTNAADLAAAPGTTVRLTLTPPAAGDYDHCQILYRLRDGAAWTTGPTYTGAQGVSGTKDVESLTAGQVYEFLAYALDALGNLGPPSVTRRASPTAGTGSLRERVLANIITALSGVTLANGYWDTLEAVYSGGHPEDLASVARPFAIVLDPTGNPIGDAIAGAHPGTLLELRILVIIASNRPTSAAQDWEAEEARRQIDAAVKAVLEAPRRADLAIDTLPGEQLVNPKVEDHLGDAVSACTFTVRLRHQRDNPSVKVPA